MAGDKRDEPGIFPCSEHSGCKECNEHLDACLDSAIEYAAVQRRELVKALERLKNCVFTEQTGEKLQAVQQADDALTAAGRKP